MKTAKLLVLCAALVCAATCFTGCASCNKCCEKQPSCKMKCCADGKTTCATCPTCSPKK